MMIQKKRGAKRGHSARKTARAAGGRKRPGRAPKTAAQEASEVTWVLKGHLNNARPLTLAGLDAVFGPEPADSRQIRSA